MRKINKRGWWVTTQPINVEQGENLPKTINVDSTFIKETKVIIDSPKKLNYFLGSSESNDYERINLG